MKILIVEDDPFVAEDLKDKLEKLQYRVTAVADSYDRALECIQAEMPDLALLDIELKGKLSGIDLSEKLSRMHIPFIYLTGIQDMNTYSLAKSTAPLKNLSKPIDLLNLRNALLEIDLPKKAAVLPIIHLMTDKDGNKVKIDPNEIVYVEAGGSYCDVYFLERGKSTLTMSMGEFIEKLGWQDLVRISRSFSINLKHLKRVRGNEAEVITGKLLKITDSYKEELARHLKIF